MEIIIYNHSFERQGIVENQTSLIWTRKYYEVGNFEMHVPITQENLKLCQKENIIYKKGGSEAGIIEDIEVIEGMTIKEIIIKGRFLESYLDRRLIKNTFTFSGNTEIAIRDLIDYVVAIPNLEKGTLNHYLEKVNFQATMKNLLTTIIKLSKSANLGFKIIPDFKNKKMIFQSYKGTDRTFAQNINSRVIFSESYNNLNKANYRWNNQILKTMVIVGGEGEASDRKYVTVGDGSVGLDLREMFVDARDISSQNLTQEEYENALWQRGIEALKQNDVSETFEYETDANINFKYKVDYDLGDIVTVWKKEWGIKLNQRITEIMEIYEYGGMKVVPVLGNPLSEKIDWSDN